MYNARLAAAFTPTSGLRVSAGGWLKQRIDSIRENLLPRIADEALEADCLSSRGFTEAVAALSALAPLGIYETKSETAKKAQALLERVLATAGKDGSFGPKPCDIGLCISALDPLMQFYSVKRDKRILVFLLKFLAYVGRTARKNALSGFAQVHAMEIARCALWLMSYANSAFLPKLCRLLCAQSVNWTGNFLSFQFTRDLKRVTRAENLSKEQLMLSDGVSNAMAVKYGALAYLIEGGNRNADASNAAWDKLMRWHGLPVGMFSGDSQLSGLSPSQGIRTRAIAEALASLSELAALTGEPVYAQRMETIALNALDAALSPDGKRCQSVQQPNQVCCDDSPHGFFDLPGGETRFADDIFACSSVARGFARYAASLWIRNEKGIMALSYAPCKVRFRIDGAPAAIEVKGDYPYSETVTIRVRSKTPVYFRLGMCVPDWAEGATAEIGGDELPPPQKGVFWLEREFSNDTITLRLPMQPRVTRHHHGSAAVHAGALAFALPLEGKNIGDDFLPTMPFGRALYLNKGLFLSSSSKLHPRARVTIKACVVPVRWNRYEGSVSAPPVLPHPVGSVQLATLVPYSTTPLRICAFPVPGGEQDETGE